MPPLTPQRVHSGRWHCRGVAPSGYQLAGAASVAAAVLETAVAADGVFTAAHRIHRKTTNRALLNRRLRLSGCLGFLPGVRVHLR